jgi:hypothetical protein
MKLLAISISSWLAGLIPVLAITHFAVEPLSFADLMGFTVMSLMAALPAIGLLYLPGLFWLRRRLGGCERAALFSVVAAFILNAPLIVFIGFQAGRSMARSEALLFICLFIITGLLFGLGFARVYRTQRPRSTSL